MVTCEYMRKMADYNRWMNEKVYAAASRLPAQELTAERGAFFGSVMGTLNHLMVADLIWLKRFTRLPAVDTALDGLHAIECEEQDPPVDLLVTDLRMPRLDGHGLIRQLRIKYVDLPVVVTSGYVSPEIAYELETQINRRIRVLSKPFDPAELRSSVGSLLAASAG